MREASVGQLLAAKVEVDFDVALRVDGEVEEAVFREEREHVVEEGDAGGDLRLTGPVDREVDGDVGFGGLAGDSGGAHGGDR